MLEKKITFDISKQLQSLSNNELANIFWILACDEYENFLPVEIFVKIGSISDSTNFDFYLSWFSDSPSKIYEIDDIRFISDALREIKNYRMIGDNICRKVDGASLKEGEYVLAVDGNPLFRITEAKSNWAYKPMNFAFYNGRGHFLHSPNYDTEPFQIDMELSVQNKRKEKILVKMYNQVLKHYKENGLKEVDIKKS